MAGILLGDVIYQRWSIPTILFSPRSASSAPTIVIFPQAVSRRHWKVSVNELPMIPQISALIPLVLALHGDIRGFQLSHGEIDPQLLKDENFWHIPIALNFALTVLVLYPFTFILLGISVLFGDFNKHMVRSSLLNLSMVSMLSFHFLATRSLSDCWAAVCFCWRSAALQRAAPFQSRMVPYCAGFCLFCCRLHLCNPGSLLQDKV